MEANANNSTLLKKPEWFKQKIQFNPTYYQTRKILHNQSLHTVCESARCPNKHVCFGQSKATFMILGNYCTRSCGFCAVDHKRPEAPDPDTAKHLSQSVSDLKLNHVVITSVTRDDLPDGGVWLFVDVIQTLRNDHPQCTIECLIPDFRGNQTSWKSMFDSKPDILNHNVETVESLYRTVRPQAKYKTSLGLIQAAHDAGLTTKSGFMVGLGETWDGMIQLMQDLHDYSCDILTIGQYLQPKLGKLPVVRYYSPEEFKQLEKEAYQIGFQYVASGPYVRSSFMAEDFFKNRRS